MGFPQFLIGSRSCSLLSKADKADKADRALAN